MSTAPTIPLPSTTLLSKLQNLPILTSVPTVLSILFTTNKQIICGWSDDTSTPVLTSVLQKYLDQCFRLIESIDEAQDFQMLRINYLNNRELIVIPNNEDSVVFCVVVEKS